MIDFKDVEGVPVKYAHDWVAEPDEAFAILWNELDWVRHPGVPRREYYVNTLGVDYTYGQKEFARTYRSQPMDWLIQCLLEDLETETGTKFEAIFLNGYDDEKDQLGWHSDNSPEMDDSRPIAIVSLGAEREIWFRNWNADPEITVTRLKLGHGSLCLMEAGMQDTHQHRIPKGDRPHGPRLSLTFRGYVPNES